MNRTSWYFGLMIVGLLVACTGRVTTPTPAPLAPTLTPTAVATRTPLPTSTLPPPTSTPAPALRRLTEPGCCTQPTWSLDGRQVIFVDKPSAAAPAGLYAVDVTQPGATPTLLTDRMLTYSPDLKAAAYPQGKLTIIEQLDSGRRWELDTGGNPPALSPDRSRVVWEDTAESGPFDARLTTVYLAELTDALKPEQILSVYGGGLVAWFPDSQRLLISGRPALTVEQRVLSVFSPADRSTVELARAERISGITLSPGGEWVAYMVTFAKDENSNGLWVVRSDGAQRQKLELFGSYQWRDDERLLIIPMEPGAISHTVWQYNVSAGALMRLTDPRVTPFRIANGDWRASPDGARMVFLNAADKALWLLTFDQP